MDLALQAPVLDMIDAGIIASAKTDAGSGFCLSEKYDLSKGSA
jgi:hypothetical protein